MKEVAPSTNLEQALRDTIDHHNHYPGYPTKRLSAENQMSLDSLQKGLLASYRGCMEHWL